jgi:hypothetical protein
VKKSAPRQRYRQRPGARSDAEPASALAECAPTAPDGRMSGDAAAVQDRRRDCGLPAAPRPPPIESGGVSPWVSHRGRRLTAGGVSPALTPSPTATGLVRRLRVLDFASSTSQARLRKLDFASSMSRARLSRARLSRARLSRARLSRARLSRARLRVLDFACSTSRARCRGLDGGPSLVCRRRPRPGVTTRLRGPLPRDLLPRPPHREA